MSELAPLSPPATNSTIPRPLQQPAPLRGRRALARIACFFAYLGLLIFLAHGVISHGLRQIETSGFGVTNRFMSGRSDAQILISGSSRALNHFDSRVIQEITGKRTFNIGRNGSQTDLQLAVLRAYLKRNRKPELIIHNLDSFSFLTSKEIYDPAQYMPYLDDEDLYEAIGKVYPDVWMWRHVPLYAYVVQDMRFSWLLGIARWFGYQPREDHVQGFQPRYTQWTGDFDAFREMHADGVDFEIEPQGVADVEAIARLCQESNIPLIFVYSPVYREMQLLERNRGEIFAHFQRISGSHGAEFLDFSQSQVSMMKDNFYNSQHLNASGAKSFSSELAWHLKRKYPADAARHQPGTGKPPIESAGNPSFGTSSG